MLGVFFFLNCFSSIYFKKKHIFCSWVVSFFICWLLVLVFFVFSKNMSACINFVSVLLLAELE